MPSRKRSLPADDGGDGPTESSLLHRIRNMWQFANLCQFIYIFGKVAKIPDAIDIEEIETECLKPSSTILSDIALSLLKLVSSHRGLTHDIFDDQARKQYISKLPGHNPFGDGDHAAKFAEFDIMTKIRVMQQLTQWIMIHPERVREKMEEHKDSEQATWRIEPYGWDADDRTYYVLDDNRIYRLTEAPPAAVTRPKKSTKTYRGGRRASKRRRTTLSTEDVETEPAAADATEEPQEDDGLGGQKWECLAVSLYEVQAVVEGFRKTRDDNERILRDQLQEHLIPILEQQEQARKRREQQRERELLNLAKMANAKRSSRLAGKAELQKQEEQAKEEDQQRRQEEAAARKEERELLKKERERESRQHSRENRLREREARRLQHEEELAQLSEDSKSLSSGNGRLSERRLQVEIEKNKRALEDLEQEDEEWVFDCACGLYGQVDDGTHSVACERCNVWQHSKCLGVSEEEAERPEFQFICKPCTRREEEAKRPRPTIKLKLNRPGSSGSPDNGAKLMTTQNETGNIEKTRITASQSTAEAPSPSPSLGHGLSHSHSHSHDHGPNGGANHLAPPSSPSKRPSTNGFTSPSPSGLDAQGQSNGAASGTLRMTPVIPAPVRLEAGLVERTPNIKDPSGRYVVSTPISFAKAASPSSIHSLQNDRTVESALSTPQISRDIYRAAYEQNGTLPAKAGFSPIKHSPPRPVSSGSAARFSAASPILPPVTLSPSPQHQVLTPPSKSSEPPRPLANR